MGKTHVDAVNETEGGLATGGSGKPGDV